MPLGTCTASVEFIATTLAAIVAEIATTTTITGRGATPVRPGEDPRAGRWRGSEPCGLH